MSTTALAKRQVHAPTWLHAPEYVLTFGPEVAEVNAKAGFAPYPEQELLLDLIFAVGPDGRSAAFEIGAIVSRQQLKTGLVVQAKVGWLYVSAVRLIVYSAHNLDAVNEAFLKTREVITGSPTLSRYLPAGRSEGMRRGKGDQVIELRDGRRIKYMTRTADNGRSLTGDKVIVDEGFAYTDEQAGALEPTLAAVEDPQKLIVSSGCKPESGILRGLRDRGRAKVGDRFVYAEWGDPDAGRGCADGEGCDHAVTRIGCALDDEERWKRIMPRHDERRLQTVRALRKSMPPKEFAREFMVWHDDPGKAETLALPGWDDLASEQTDRRGAEVEPPDAGLVIGFAVSVDQEYASIAAGSRWPDGRIHLGAVDRRRGTRWLLPRLLDLQDRRACAVVGDEKLPDASLKQTLDDGGLEVEWFTLDEVTAAYSWIVNAVREKDITHFGHAELDAAVKAAVPRAVGDGRNAWGRRKSEAPVDMLEAANFAGYGVDQGLTGGAFSIY